MAHLLPLAYRATYSESKLRLISRFFPCLVVPSLIVHQHQQLPLHSFMHASSLPFTHHHLSSAQAAPISSSTTTPCSALSLPRSDISLACGPSLQLCQWFQHQYGKPLPACCSQVTPSSRMVQPKKYVFLFCLLSHPLHLHSALGQAPAHHA
jgi:hypothetical protein